MKATRLAVRGVLLHEGDMGIMYVNEHDCYLFPGGEVEPGESMEEGLIRELEEETGYLTEVVEHLTQVVYEEPTKVHHNEIYLCRVVGNGHLQKTALEVDWGINFQWMNPFDLQERCVQSRSRYPDSIIHQSLCLVASEVLAALTKKGYL
jgi:8-oxo-dGTP pyrophosphatase MutT (NUDIX family)